MGWRERGKKRRRRRRLSKCSNSLQKILLEFPVMSVKFLADTVW